MISIRFHPQKTKFPVSRVLLECIINYCLNLSESYIFIVWLWICDTDEKSQSVRRRMKQWIAMGKLKEIVTLDLVVCPTAALLSLVRARAQKRVRLAPTPPRKGPSPARTGSFGGRKPSNGSPHGSPVYWGELKLPPRMGGVETPPISLITPFLYDINLVWAP